LIAFFLFRGLVAKFRNLLFFYIIDLVYIYYINVQVRYSIYIKF
jgi:hypothetical protein